MPSTAKPRPLSMLHIILFRPSIAGNVGAVLRTATCFGADLHVIGPTPFQLWGSTAFKRGAGASRLQKIGNGNSTSATNEDAAILDDLRVGSTNAGSSLPSQLLWYSDTDDFLERCYPRLSAMAAMTKFANKPIYPAMQQWLAPQLPQSPSTVDIGIGILLGNESRGLQDFPLQELLLTFESHSNTRGHQKLQAFSLPMLPAARSHNLAVSAGIAAYEAHRVMTMTMTTTTNSNTKQ